MIQQGALYLWGTYLGRVSEHKQLYQLSNFFVELDRRSESNAHQVRTYTASELAGLNTNGRLRKLLTLVGKCDESTTPNVSHP